MSVTIQTVITNKSRGVRSLIISRSKAYSLRAGETVVLDYDIWSYLTPTAKRKLESDVNMGRLDITTRLYTDNTNISVDTSGTYMISNGGLEDSKPKEQVKTAKLPAASSNKEETKGKLFTSDGTVIADKSASVMQNSLGAKRVEAGGAGQAEQKTAMDGTGFTKTDMSTSGLMHTTNNLEAANTSSVFGAKETASTQDTAEESKEPNTDEAMPREDYINELYAAKDYSAIAGALTEWHPGTTFTKASIKKCSSYAELKEKYAMLV